MSIFSALARLFGVALAYLLLTTLPVKFLLLGIEDPGHSWKQLGTIIGSQNETVEGIQRLVGQRELECTQESVSVLPKIKTPEVAQYLVSRLKDEPPNLIKAYALYKAIMEIAKSCRIGYKPNLFYWVSPVSREYQLIKVYLEALCRLEFSPLLLGNLPFDTYFFIINDNMMSLNFPGMSRAFPDEIGRLHQHIVQLANAQVRSGFDLRTNFRIVSALIPFPSFTLANFEMYLQNGLHLTHASELYGNWVENGIRQNRFDIAYYVFCQDLKLMHYTMGRKLFASFVSYVVMRRAFVKISSLLAALTEEDSVRIPKDILRSKIFSFLSSLEYPRAHYDVAKCWGIKP